MEIISLNKDYSFNGSKYRLWTREITNLDKEFSIILEFYQNGTSEPHSKENFNRQADNYCLLTKEKSSNWRGTDWRFFYDDFWAVEHRAFLTS